VKEPIDRGLIRRGDRIRVEYTKSENGSPRAIEYVAEHDRMGMRNRMNGTERLGAAYFLLDRPKPPVELPTQPTLGWLSAEDEDGKGGTFLATWQKRPDLVLQCRVAGAWGKECVTAFVPATAVPTEALEKLRERHEGGEESPVAKCGWVSDFLLAVDRANS